MRTFEGYKNGVNLGGWISQFKVYDEKHFAEFIVEDDIKNISEFGFDHVRVPVDYMVLEDEEGNLKESGFQYLENCRLWCKKYNLKMLIDLHEAYGYTFDPMKKTDKRKFFLDSDLQARFFKLWTEILNRFKDHTDMVAFEPLNEVVPEDDEIINAWNGILTKYIALVRSIASDAYIVVGGVCYNSVKSVPWLDVPVDDHVVYNFHCYEPLMFTHQGAHWIDVMPRDFRIDYPKTLKEYQEASSILPKEMAGAIFEEGISEIGPKFFEDLFAPAIKKATKDDVPMYCGEYGVIDLADKEAALRWIRDIHITFHKYGIGSALWNYKSMDYGISDAENVVIKNGLKDVL